MREGLAYVSKLNNRYTTALSPCLFYECVDTYFTHACVVWVVSLEKNRAFGIFASRQVVPEVDLKIRGFGGTDPTTTRMQVDYGLSLIHI